MKEGISPEINMLSTSPKDVLKDIGTSAIADVLHKVAEKQSIGNAISQTADEHILKIEAMLSGTRNYLEERTMTLAEKEVVKHDVNLEKQITKTEEHFSNLQTMLNGDIKNTTEMINQNEIKQEM
jgi:hypothetical protein